MGSPAEAAPSLLGLTGGRLVVLLGHAVGACRDWVVECSADEGTTGSGRRGRRYGFAQSGRGARGCRGVGRSQGMDLGRPMGAQDGAGGLARGGPGQRHARRARARAAQRRWERRRPGCSPGAHAIFLPPRQNSDSVTHCTRGGAMGGELKGWPIREAASGCLLHATCATHTIVLHALARAPTQGAVCGGGGHAESEEEQDGAHVDTRDLQACTEAGGPGPMWGGAGECRVKVGGFVVLGRGRRVKSSRDLPCTFLLSQIWPGIVPRWPRAPPDIQLR